MPRRYPNELYPLLKCVCSAHASLHQGSNILLCSECGARHPIVDGVPVILDPEKSVFEAKQVISQYEHRSQRRNWVQTLRRFVPAIGSNLIADRAMSVIAEMLKNIEHPRILVVGGGETGDGLEALLADPRYILVESDIYFGERCNIIADGHDLPFRSESFDAVICQAVLEHVIRPQRCIDEMHRVLKPKGLVFIDVPFLYPVHMGAHDFTRFSLGGLRAACRWFEEREAGVSGGPGQAVAYAAFYFSWALSRSKIWTAFTLFVLPWFIFWLHHLDKLIVRRPYGSDSASGVYFIGRKANRPRSDREILQVYWANAAARRRPEMQETSLSPTPQHAARRSDSPETLPN